MLTQFCSDVDPVFFGLLDFSIAPPLLYYSYIPVVIFSLWLAVRTFIGNKKEKTVILFSITALSLSMLALSNLLGWIAAPVWLVKLSWQVWGLASVVFSLISYLFVYRLVFDKSPSAYVKYVLYLLLLPVIVLLPTRFNIEGFDYDNCEAIMSIGYSYYIYVYQAIIILLLIYSSFLVLIKKLNSTINKNRALIILFSSVVLNLFFLITSFWGEYISDYRVELVAPVGVLIFLISLSYITFDNKKFNLNILGAEMLVTVLFIIMLGILLISDVKYIHLVTYASLFITALIGHYLIRSVRREVKQREEIEKLATSLREVNRIMSHDVKGALGKHAMLFKSLSQGEFGEIPEAAKGFVDQSAKESMKLIDNIMIILQSGHEISFRPTKFNFGNLVREVSDSLLDDAKKKGLELNLNISNSDQLEVELDQAYIKMHVIQNLISNSINYTLTGKIDVFVEKTTENKILFKVSDTGVGVTAEDAPKLFKEAGHGAHSTEINIHSTGYGLFSAKRVVDACGGRIWFESEGIPGKGTTFFVELPIRVDSEEEVKK